MTLKQMTEACFSHEKGQGCITQDVFLDVKQRCNLAVDVIKQQVDQGDLPLLALRDIDRLTREVEDIASPIREKFSTLLILGTGGSTLCGQIYTDFVSEPSGTDVIFLDNIDPSTMLPTLNRLELEKTFVLTISKSGSTMETLGQFFILLERYEQQLGAENIKQHMACISDDIPSIVRDIAGRYGIQTYEHERKIGGRFSLVTNVGLIPAAVAGLDIRRLLAGMNEQTACSLTENSAAVESASLLFCAMENGLSMNIWLIYSDKLRGFSQWYRQIWAESLGKDGQGSTPINAHGTLDQHSQQQLYLDGPNDKFYTTLLVNESSDDATIHDKFIVDSSLDYMKGASLSDLFSASGKATRDTLISQGRPVRQIELPQLDEYVLGQLIMHSVFETVYMAHLMQINPFDQPAVEAGKIRARAMLAQES